MINTVKINEKPIGKGYPTFLLVEIAFDPQGNVDYALDSVGVSIKAKIDAKQILFLILEIFIISIKLK